MSNALIAILYGLGGAVGWGVSNFFAAKSSKSSNPLATVFVSQSMLFITMLVVVVVTGNLSTVPTSYVFTLAFSYLLFTTGLVISYKAFAIGPVSVTSPIAGAFSIIVLLNTVFLFGERLSGLQWLGMFVLFGGLFLLPKNEGNGATTSKGIIFAFAALLLLGFGLTGFVYAIAKIGWMKTVLLGYFFTAAWSGLFIFVKKQKIERLEISRFTIGLVSFQLLGTIAVSYGVEKSLASIIVPVSSISPLITAIAGVYFLRERLSKKQVAGIVLVGVSLVLLAL